MRLLFLVSALALPFAVFVVLALTRKARYRSLAEKLRAKHLEVGLFAPGAIVGEDFRIEATQVGKTYRTHVQVSAGETPGRFFLRPEFFQDAPNWSFAWVPGRRTERVFLWEVTVGGHAQPDREQQSALLRWLPRIAELGNLHADLKGARIRSIVIDDGTVSTDFNGILSNLSRIRGTLDVLRRLSPSRSCGNA